MKQFLFLILTNAFLKGYGQTSDSAFLTKVSTDFSRNSYFISFKVITNGKPLSVVIRNEELYFYFYKTKKYNKTQYLESLKTVVNKKKTLFVSEEILKRYHFIIIEPNSKIDSEVKKGKDVFLSKYFKHGVLIEGINNSDKFYIVQLLFRWRIPSRIDDESGYLVL